MARWTGLVIVAWAALLCAAGVANAQGKPGTADIREEVQGRLDATFEADLFKVRRAERLETRETTVEGDDRASVLVAFRAELKFQQAYRLSSWDSHNVGTLVHLLGSSPRGIRGVAAAGNQRGDVLTVEGTIAFARDGDDWAAVESSARLEEKPRADANASPIRQELQQRLAEIGEAAGSDGADTGELDLGADLDQLVADVECRLADRRGVVRLATASATTEYFALGTGLAAALNSDAERIHVRQTLGSVHNVQLLHGGVVDAAFVQNDIAQLAHTGAGPFQGKLPMDDLVGLAALFPELVHVVTVEGAGIASLADLRGAVVDVGPDDSGTRFNAAQVLAAAGLSLGDLGGVQGSPPGDAIDDLLSGRVQAAIMTGARPYPEVSANAIRAPLRLVPLGDEEIAAITAEAPYMMPMTIPARTYAHQDEAVQTIGVSALLVARSDLSDDAVSILIGTLMGDDPTLAEHTVQAWYISPWTAERGLPIPLHPAARAALDELRAGGGGAGPGLR